MSHDDEIARIHETLQRAVVTGFVGSWSYTSSGWNSPGSYFTSTTWDVSFFGPTGELIERRYGYNEARAFTDAVIAQEYLEERRAEDAS